MRARFTGWILGLALVLQGGFSLAGDVVEYYHLDAVGNVLAVTDSNGVTVEQHDYLPYGEEWCGNQVCGSVTPGQPKRFTGKERDAETGLDYFGARYYGSKIARFTTTDPFLDQRAAILDPQRWNRYAYGRNNPLRYVDPDGRDVGEAAAWVQNQVSFASSFYTQAAVSSGNPALAASTTFVASSLELGINGIADAFRVGESTGAALGRGDSGLAFAAAVAEDAGRAGGLALLALAPATRSGAPSQVQANRAAGNAFRDEIAGLLQKAGRDVQTEVYKPTPFGRRFIDIEVSQGGKVLGGVETKAGGRYKPSQRAKDTWLKNAEGYPVNVARDK